jgi:hypothetical protein
MTNGTTRGRYGCRSIDDSVVVFDTENDDAWIRSDVTEDLSWMD